MENAGPPLSSWHRQPWKISFPRWTLLSLPLPLLLLHLLCSFLPSTSTFAFPSCSSPLSLSLSLSPSGLSLLQIGLVVLRVHQDNSPAWLCVSSKRTLLSSSFSLSLPLPFLFFFLLQGMRERKRWRETRNKGNILYERRCACFMFCPFRDPSQCTHSFKEFLRVPAPPRSESSSPRAFCASFLPAVLGFQERRSARAQLLPRSLAIGDAPVAHGPESRFQPARVTFSKKEKRENQVNDLDQLLFVLIFATVNDWES